MGLIGNLVITGVMSSFGDIVRERVALVGFLETSTPQNKWRVDTEVTNDNLQIARTVWRDSEGSIRK